MQPNVSWHVPFRDEQTVKGKFRVRCGGKTDLNFLETDLHERLEQLQFLRNVHWHSERLVTVAQIHTAPTRRARESYVRPTPVFQFNRRKRTILFGRILEHDYFAFYLMPRDGQAKKIPPPFLAVGLFRKM